MSEVKRMVVGDSLVSVDHMKKISKIIGPIMSEVWNSSKSITVKSLADDVSKKMPDTDRLDIELCAQYLWNREFNKPIDPVALINELKRRDELKQYGGTNDE